jgi:hypothetical protein
MNIHPILPLATSNDNPRELVCTARQIVYPCSLPRYNTAVREGLLHLSRRYSARSAINGSTFVARRW